MSGVECRLCSAVLRCAVLCCAPSSASESPKDATSSRRMQNQSTGRAVSIFQYHHSTHSLMHISVSVSVAKPHQLFV